MRTFAILLLILALNLSACGHSTMNELLHNLSGGCCDKNYKPKSETELTTMTPEQLVDELIQIEFHWDAFREFHDMADYRWRVIRKHVGKAGIKVLPVLSRYLDAFDPKKASGCDMKSFSVVSMAADDLDRFEFRLRGTKEGLAVIDSLERAIARMKDAGFADSSSSSPKNNNLSILETYLKRIKGLNQVDQNIQDTLWVNRKINITDAEMLEFSTFLISRDPSYPSWSETELKDIDEKDARENNDFGPITRIYSLKNPERFYESYNEFKASRLKSTR